MDFFKKKDTKNSNEINKTKAKKGLFSMKSNETIPDFKNKTTNKNTTIGKIGVTKKTGLVNKKKMRNFLIGIFVIALLAGGVLAIYFLVIKKKDDGGGGGGGGGGNTPPDCISESHIVNELDNEIGPGMCDTDCDCNGARVCSDFGFCQGIAKPPLTQPTILPEYTVPPITVSPPIPPSQDEVYSSNRNIWTYDDAEAVCKSQNSELATYEQLVDAAENGANWCNLGWVKSDTSDDSDPYKYAHFPVQKSTFDKIKSQNSGRDACGKTWNSKYDGKDYTIQGGGYNKNKLLAVNCFGIKRDAKIDEIAQMHELSKGPSNAELEEKINDIKHLTDNISLVPYTNTQWSEYGSVLGDAASSLPGQ
jgi:hypothetical protein